MGMSAAEAERLARFEQEQEERFQQSKEAMEAKLAKALDMSPIKGEEDRKEFINAYIKELELERAALMAQWRNEMMREQDKLRNQDSMQRLMDDCYDALIKPCADSLWKFLIHAEVVLSNMPSTIGAVALSWVHMGDVWFKWMEEVVPTCNHVWYYSKECSFREFPGCFACDVDNLWYKAALYFHYFCSSISAVACLLFLFKVILAPQAVWDLLKNPTTSTSAGVWCIAMTCTFAGHNGFFGEMISIVTVYFHVVLSIWFLYMALFKFRLWPDPGWFPCVVGISYAAIKTWIYFPMAGLLIMAVGFSVFVLFLSCTVSHSVASHYISLTFVTVRAWQICTLFFIATFFVSVARAYLNHKLAATVCWIQLSAPSLTLYALTLVSQPTELDILRFEQSPEAKAQYQSFLTTYYLPTQHIFMFLTMVGLVSAVHSLWVRWPTFQTKPFSPAHIAFCFPTLSHTNAIQAYRATVLALSSKPADSLFHNALFYYWCFFLVASTLLNIIFTIKYARRLPGWTKVDTAGEQEPPPPAQTLVQDMMNDMEVHEIMKQPFVSPAVLLANEGGILVRLRRDTEEFRAKGPFVRTRRIASLGFDLTLDENELRTERNRLYDWASHNAPRRRRSTMSDFLMRFVGGGGSFGDVESTRDTYGTFPDQTHVKTPIARGHAPQVADI